MKIQNASDIASSALRKSACEIAEAGLQAIDTEKIVKNAVRVREDSILVNGEEFPLKKNGGIFVVGVGKCATEAAHALESILGARLSGGVIIDVKTGAPLKKIIAYKGSHPLPTEANIEASSHIVALLRPLSEDDFVIFIISGGGSTLLCLPEDSGCQEESKILHELMVRGAAIQEVNVVRKHLSLARGGYLAEYAYPAHSVALIFSDVPGNDIQYVASGPTVKDTTTRKDAEIVLSKYDVLNACHMDSCGLIETPKDDKYFVNIKNIVVASNSIALSAMAEKAKELGFASEVRTQNLVGEARDAGKTIVEDLHSAPPKSALLYGGETTVTVRGHGKGGRNMELALSALRFLKEREAVLALASDGRDNSDIAGAICDIMTRENAVRQNLNIEKYLADNNEYPFFQAVGDYLLTGDTGSNVSDLIIAIKE
ncbi:MAG: hypothetical protein A3C12_00855 [Candidatus Sungbacteria bacterium RIFCSPHIGHO2_02_FULL_49_20]|uniref:Glycerate kinase n=1 Tax=Candidatus Sungbacteria bacterium RIFCSPHIGHO2_02_FULL_49_20 TaxID=1802272 RepID=A0A1G2KQT5_9BACT|nr:MAG: hypothetical protein A3C12_00855 [Candidatus Sungbacteria bacterium RIFCSPHIGHO2_02_FULL_49_20]